MILSLHFKDFDGLVRGTCSQSSSVIVQYSVMLLLRSSAAGWEALGSLGYLTSTYNHVIVTGIGDYLRLGHGQG